MSKRILSDQQKRRINKLQKRHREQAADLELVGEGQAGLITAHFGKNIEVEDNDGKIRRCFLRQNLGAIAVGDRVIWLPCNTSDNDTHVITAIMPRKNTLTRYNKFTGSKLIASNIDQLFIVVAIEPPRAINVLDRYLMLAELQQIKPIIVFNKIDLLDVQDIALQKDFLQLYQDIGYQVNYTSINESQTIDHLKSLLTDKTSVFVGLSGVGKSSLLKAIAPENEVSIGELSVKSREGNHTTTTARLYHLADHATLIDCPGIRELAMGNLTPSQVIQGFKELRDLAANCQFRDCKHERETGCAIIAAIESGKMPPDRLMSYQNIITEIANEP
jgi:ribosome biogenesis GTPase